jgi:hypothetical protein
VHLENYADNMKDTEIFGYTEDKIPQLVEQGVSEYKSVV